MMKLKEKLNKLFIDFFYKKHGFLLLGILIGCLIAIVVSFAVKSDVFESFELNVLDWKFKTFQSLRQKPDKNIIIVGVDEQSVAKIGRWPWARDQHAKIIDFLSIYGAKAIVFDIFFSYKDDEHPDADEKLANSAKKAGNVYMISRFIPVENDYKQDLEALSRSKMHDNSIIDFFDVPAESAENLIPEGKKLGFQLPYSSLEKAVRKYGTVHSGDADYYNKIRFQNLIYNYKNNLYSSLSLAVAKDYLAENNDLKQKIEIPVDEKNQVIINWNATEKTDKKGFLPPYKQYSAWKLAESYDNIMKASKACGVSPKKFKQILDELYLSQKTGKALSPELNAYLNKIPEDFELKFDSFNPSELFKDKIVFVGIASTSTTVRDFISTPFFSELPGVYVQANMVDNLINKNFIYKETKTITILAVFILSILTAVSIFCLRNSLLGIIYSIFLNIFYLLISIFAFVKFNWWFDMVYTEIAIILTFAASSAVYFLIEEKEKIKIKRAMANYISPQIMDEVLSDPSKLKLGGTKKELSILFSDVRGFTNLSEQIEPEEVVKLLNEYFTAMVEIILKNNGTVDKFIGDAIMAFWNAPVSIDEHQYLAVKTAIEMIEELEKLKKKWQSENQFEIDIGIGINTADVVIGNIGSDKIKDFTIIGDGVNTASRIESITKEYKVKVIISESTYESVKDKVEAKYLDTCKLKGKNKLIKVYEVIGLKN